MPPQWFVRVHGKEYGPVDLDELHEWRAEGRLIPDNELRGVGETDWRKAGEFVELFAPAVAKSEAADPLFRRRTLLQIIGDAFVIYARGFFAFFSLALLVGVPSLAMKVSLAFVHTAENGTLAPGSMLPAMIAALSFALTLVAWPIFLAGLQFATADIVARRPVRVGDLLARAMNIWPRMAKLSLFVYGSYIFWTVPLLVILSITNADPTALLALLTLLALAVQVYMVGRLFISFLFWQQSATIGGLEGIDALRESTQLARSNRAAPMPDRPVFRGATLASIWLLVLLASNVAVQLPFLFMRLQGITTVEEVTDLMHNLMSAPTPDAMTLVSYVLTSLLNTLLRPLLGIAFVLLYFDIKARQ